MANYKMGDILSISSARWRDPAYNLTYIVRVTNVINSDPTYYDGEWLEGNDTFFFSDEDVIGKYATAAKVKEISRVESTNEVRSVSSTGGEKGVKLARFDLIPARAHRLLAEHYGRGVDKYSDNNWRRGYEWSKSIAALERHLNAFKDNEDYDEIGSLHLVAVAWHAFTLIESYFDYPEFDDRWKGVPVDNEESERLERDEQSKADNGRREG